MKAYRSKFHRDRYFFKRLIPLFLFLALASTNSMAQILWQQTNGPEGGTINALAINDSGYIFAGTDGGGVFRSTNNGNSWTAVNTGLTNTDVRAFAISGNIFFAGTFGGGVFRRSMDSWEPFNTGLMDTYVYALAINDSGYIFAGTNGGGVFRSTVSGNSWTAVNTGLTNTFVRALAVKSRLIFAGTGVGPFRSDNNGDTWNPFTTNPGINIVVNAFAINSAGYIFVGAIGGVFLSTTGGRNLDGSHRDLIHTRVQSLAINDSGHIFAGTNGDGVFRSTNNGGDWTADNTGLTDNRVFALVVTAGGVIFAGTDGGGVFRGVDYPSTLSLSTTVNFDSLSKASDYEATHYRIVGLPGGSNPPVFVTDFLRGEQNKDWQVFWDNGDPSNDPNNYLVEFDGSQTFQFSRDSVGRAFWIIHRGLITIDDSTVAAAPLNPDQEAEIPLHSGWNLITNPFDRPVSWSEVQAANGNLVQPIHAFDGNEGFREAATFEPYVGYYFFNDNSTPDTLKVPFLATFPAPHATPASKRYRWEVRIGLTSGETIDRSTSFGMADNASRNLDHFDYRKPRTVAAIPGVYFQRPKWDADYSIFATDIRPEFEDSETWEFEVLSPQLKSTTLTFSGIESVPAQHEVYLIDDERGDFVNLRVDSVYQFTPKKEIAKFRVIVGEADSVDDLLSLVLPKEFELGPNYPNPFNPSTNIPVAVPFDSEITLKVYNIRGQEVRTIYSGQIAAGRHLVEWDGKDARGKTIASGVYIYRLTTSSKVSLTGKMLLMK